MTEIEALEAQLEQTNDLGERLELKAQIKNLQAGPKEEEYLPQCDGDEGCLMCGA